MSLNAINLSVLAYANSFTLWHYTTTDASITGAGYFNQATDMLRVNDLIMANVDTGNQASVRFYAVVKSQGGVVEIADTQAVIPIATATLELAPEPEFDWDTVKPGMAFVSNIQPGKILIFDAWRSCRRTTGKERLVVVYPPDFRFTIESYHPDNLKRAPEHDITL